MKTKTTALRRYLKRQKLPAHQLFKRVNDIYPVTYSRVCQVINGQRPSADLAAALSKVTGLSREQIIYDGLPRTQMETRKR